MRICSRVMVIAAALASAPAAAGDKGMDRIAEQISAALDRHPLVGLGEHHRRSEIHEVYRALLRDPRVMCKLDDIAVEFGNSALQPVADRFAAGEPVSEAEKRTMWRDTGQWLVWDSPLYEQFFDAVRDANARKLCPKPVRILLADPPIRWSEVHTAVEYRPYRIRDQFFASVIEREILAKGHHALLIFGDTHLWRALPAGSAEKPTMGVLIQEKHPGALVSYTLPPADDVPKLTRLPAAPALFELAGTSVGKASFAKIAATDQPIMMTVKGKVVDAPMRKVIWPRAQDVIDGIFNLPPGQEIDPDPVIFRDPAYQAELRRRAAILKEVHGIDFEADLNEILAQY